MVFFTLRGQNFCGGAVVHKNWAQAAASCVIYYIHTVIHLFF